MLRRFLGMERGARDNLILVAFTVLFAGAYLFLAMKIPSVRVGGRIGPKVFPIALGIAALIAAGMLVFETFWPRRTTEAPQQVAETVDWRGRLVVAAVVAWTVLYLIVFERLGYIVATTIYLGALVGYFYRRSRPIGAIVVVTFCVSTYFLFKNFLGVYLGAGVLPF